MFFLKCLISFVEKLVKEVKHLMKLAKQNQLDPLYVIFEQHLYNFPDADLGRQGFIEQVLQDYFSYLRKKNITVPKSLEIPIMEELFEQVNSMLIKKIYGCLSIEEYQNKVPSKDKKKVKTKYSRLKKTTKEVA